MNYDHPLNLNCSGCLYSQIEKQLPGKSEIKGCEDIDIVPAKLFQLTYRLMTIHSIQSFTEAISELVFAKLQNRIAKNFDIT